MTSRYPPVLFSAAEIDILLSKGFRAHVSRGPMGEETALTKEPLAEVVTRLLERVAAGSMTAEIDGRVVAVLDAQARNLAIDVNPLVTNGVRIAPLLPGGGLHPWRNRRFPSALARTGWHVSLSSGSRELLRAGRGVSALTGHVYVHPTAIRELRRIL